MALSLQEQGIGRSGWCDDIPYTPGLSDHSPEKFLQTIDHMIDTEILHSDEGVIGIGDRGEKNYGYRNFMDLFAVFTTEPLVKVMHGRQLIGEVDVTTFASRDEGSDHQGAGGVFLVLAGRAWQLVNMDWNRSIAYVEPSDERGSSRWISTGVPLSFDLCQSIKRSIMSSEVPPYLSLRAKELFEELQDEYDWLEEGYSFLISNQQDEASWWTFAGKSYNAAVSASLQSAAKKVRSTNLSVDFIGVSSIEKLLKEIIKLISSEGYSLAVPLDSDFVQKLKFHECLSLSLIHISEPTRPY